MLEITEKYAETTEITQSNSVIDDVLGSLKISGSLLLRETYAAPWAVHMPDASTLESLLKLPEGTQAVAFHLLEFGHCEISLKDGETHLLKAGDMVICFGGGEHRISAGKHTRGQTAAALLSGAQNLQAPDQTGRPAATSLLCGVFLLRHSAFNPLLEAMPAIVQSSLTRSGEMHNLSGVARLLAHELERAGAGSAFIVERLLEVLCAEAVRAHLEGASHEALGWFRALRDPVVGRAIAAIHHQPGADWSIPKLAEVVSMSPSRFAARFSAALGASPMNYVTQWRMNIACRKLMSSRDAVDQVAADVGYESHAAFNRTFKKWVGLPPAAWRAKHRGEMR